MDFIRAHLDMLVANYRHLRSGNRPSFLIWANGSFAPIHVQGLAAKKDGQQKQGGGRTDADARGRRAGPSYASKQSEPANLQGAPINRIKTLRMPGGA
jgi:hypothetical protein